MNRQSDGLNDTLNYHWIQFMCKIFHIFSLSCISLCVAIATRIFNIGRKEKDVHNLQTAIYPYLKFHNNISITFCVNTGSSLCVKFATFSVYLLQ
jgi:hypothetical protein